MSNAIDTLNEMLMNEFIGWVDSACMINIPYSVNSFESNSDKLDGYFMDRLYNIWLKEKYGEQFADSFVGEKS